MLQSRLRIVAGIILAVLACRGSTVAPNPGPDTTAAPPFGVLTAIGEMRQARALHTATLLNDGRVLIVGGGTPESPLGTAEIIDANGTAASQVIPLMRPRLGHTATLLPDGQVLIVGGGYGEAAQASRSAELFDPSTNTFRPTGALVEPRADHAAVFLNNGRVLIVGGDASGVGRTPTATAELYDPATGASTSTGSMATPRRPYGVTVLSDGRVLVAGGTSTGRRIIADAETYDPATGRFSPTGRLSIPREKHTAARLADGRVLIAGGSRGAADADRLAATEIYDPAAGRFTAGPAMRSARHKVVSAALANGAVLIVGGSRALAEVYVPSARRFSPVTGGGDAERFYPAATSLADGSVLITGGYTAGGSRLSVWRYRPK